MARRTVRAEGLETGTGRRKACVVAKKARRRRPGKSASSGRVLLNMMVGGCAGVEGLLILSTRDRTQGTQAAQDDSYGRERALCHMCGSVVH